MMRKTSFAPVTAPGTRVLVLGSLPGERSLAEGRYYAHPRNLFWHLAGRVLDRNLPDMDYAGRIEALLGGGIGLWDTVASARRQGSLDADLRDVEHNPLGLLIARLPDLRAVAFNGKASARIGAPLLAGSGLRQVVLPSSSPAHAAMPLAEKERAWLELREILA